MDEGRSAETDEAREVDDPASADFVTNEWLRWRRSAAEELEVAVANRDLGYHNVAVLHAGQAVEHALKGLLLGVGATPERTHDLVALLDDAVDRAALDVSDERIRDELRVLTRDHNPSRYPDAVPQGTPRGNYSRADANRAVTAARSCLSLVDDAWTRLQAAARGDAEDDNPCP